ncbi:hypothetical protein WN51_10216 [Melipona quadrifasciata]|uniref:Uncharacterized protein n=1 Tax=Melipona quadrifasciata TaxID=166423 RepID=A0A0M9A5X5_9HYME|nr:hypothetical protein WN51_10216 [Melipona quadrifasciata]
MRTMIKLNELRLELERSEKVIAHFESKDKSFYKKGIEKLEERRNECITLEKNLFLLA